MNNKTKIVLIIIIAFVAFNYKNEISSFFSNKTGSETDQSANWSGLREKALKSYKYDAPEIAIDYLIEYEKVVNKEFIKVSNQANDPHAISKLSCELGFIYMKLAEKYLQLSDETLYYEYLTKGREHIKECSDEINTQDT